MIVSGMTVVYTGEKFKLLRGKRLEVSSVFSGKAAVTFKGEGYVLNVANLAPSKGVETWDGRRKSA